MTKLNLCAAIVAALPSKLEKSATFAGTVSALVSFFRGERLHKYEGWNVSGGYCNLTVNADVSRALAILRDVGLIMQIQNGNDAPRGGKVGDYVYTSRVNNRVANFLERFAELRADLRVADQWGYISWMSTDELKTEKKFMLDIMAGAKLSKSDIVLYTKYVDALNELIEIRGAN